tara:strand:- start:1183 stop:1398 length:216 start_codon:yes stop_codon:yes gene_type:complete
VYRNNRRYLPAAHLDIRWTGTQATSDHCLRRRVLQHTIIAGHEAEEDFACLIEIVVLGNTHHNIDSTRGVA